MKNTFKEIVVTLLIIIVIALIIVIILYQYTPTNKVIPSKVTAYQTPENIVTEISVQNDVQEFSTETTNILYEVTDSDLQLYTDLKSYNKGKSDPFSETAVESANTTTNTTSIESGEAKGGQTTDTNTTDNYFQSAGISGGTK